MGAEDFPGTDTPDPAEIAEIAAGGDPEQIDGGSHSVRAATPSTDSEAVQIPIKGPEGDNDPATQDWRKKNWEMDSDRAHDMAIAGDNQRTFVSKEEGKLRQMEQYQKDHKAILEDPKLYKPKRPWNSERELSKTGQEALDQSVRRGEEVFRYATGNYERGYQGDQPLEMAEQARQEVETGQPSTELEKWRQDFRNHIELAAQYADKKEEIAGLIHDASEEYKSAHPKISFNADYLLAIERAVEDADKQGIPDKLRQEIENTSKEVKEGGNLLNYSRGATGLLDDLETRGVDVAELSQEYTNLRTSKATTLGEMAAFRQKLERRMLEEDLRDLEEKRQVIDDVRSGRASRPPEPEAVAA